MGKGIDLDSLRERISPRMLRVFGVLVFVGFAVLIVVGLVALGERASRTATLNIQYAPLEATILVNGKKVSGNTHKVVPGEYVVTAQMEGFAMQEKTVSIKDGGAGLVYFVLESNDPSTQNWYLEHEEDARVASGLLYYSSQGDSEQMIDDYPAIRYLPYETSIYTIGYGECEYNDRTCIVFSSNMSVGAWSVALKRFGQMDSDYGKYYYEFSNYTNPFRGGVAVNVTNADEVEVAMQGAFSDISGSFTVKSVELFNDDYMIVLLSYGGANADIYRSIFIKDGEGWKMLVKPVLIISYGDWPEIPTSVIKEANKTF